MSEQNDNKQKKMPAAQQEGTGAPASTGRRGPGRPRRRPQTESAAHKAQNTPPGAPPAPHAAPSGHGRQSGQSGQKQSGQNQNGQNQNGQNQNGQSQNGQSQNGQNQNGQNQNGQNQSGQSQNGQSQNGQNQNGQSQNGQKQNGQKQNGQKQNGQNQNGQNNQGGQPKRQNQNQPHRKKQPAPESAPANAAPIAAQPTPEAKTRGRRRGRQESERKKPVLRIVPLGGLGEVGKNITVFECQGDAFIADCGLTFPDEGMPGIDLVIPDFSYIIENRDRIRGIVITHGHEDHIGSLPYLLKQALFPVYATRLTIGLIEGKLKEHGLLGKVQLNVVAAGGTVKMGCMSVEFINVNHSIPDSCAFAIETPAGTVVHTGDFKIDFTPIRGDIIDLARFGELGRKGVLALLSDSTNSERHGISASERTVGESFDKIFANMQGKRIIVASFSSNVHRVQQIVDNAVKYKRKVAVSGRSMENTINKTLEIGYLDIPSGVLVDVDDIGKYPAEKMVIITTGSQGEPMSALTRMAMGDHRKVNITPNDCIIISATPIPGNEKLVTKVINELLKSGAEVLYEKMFDIHVSGHAYREEQKLLLALTKPKFFIPVHGEYKHLKKHAEIAASMGIERSHIFLGDNGKVIETDGETMRFDGTVTAGKVFVDGLGVGDVGSIVLRDRKHLAQDGLIIVVTAIDVQSGELISGPDIVSRGFVYVRESEEMIGKVREIARASVQKCIQNGTREWGVFKTTIRDDVGNYIWQITKRSPMILPIIQEI